MTDADRTRFFDLLSKIYAFYDKDLSEFTCNTWFRAMQPFEWPAVREALSRHCIHPDNGQFLPKPADVVRLLQGSTQDSALIACSKIEEAIRKVGTYVSVTFDDPLIQQVIQDMGGWIALGNKKENEWPFVRNELINRYRGYRQLGPLKTWPAILIGIAEASNQSYGFEHDPPVLLGDQHKAQQVLAGGSAPGLAITRPDGREGVRIGLSPLAKLTFTVEESA
jgi:hypothetical protein